MDNENINVMKPQVSDFVQCSKCVNVKTFQVREQSLNYNCVYACYCGIDLTLVDPLALKLCAIFSKGK